jgi:uncharacterized protein (DUF2235 family)
MAKNVVVFCDGTGNDRTTDEFDTNVAMFYARALHSKQGEPQLQVTYYDAGVGTEWGDLIGKATGTGISKNIQQAYDFLVRNYEPGDRIFVFGFSRGAYTVRSLAGLVGLCGVAKTVQTTGGKQVDLRADEKARAAIVAKAYGVYKTGQGEEGREERLKKAEDFRRDHAYPEHNEKDHPEKRAVYFIGVWDTVRSLGVPLGFMDIELTLWPHRFHDHDLSEHVAYAYHALSIDDERQPFHPTIWNEPTKAQRIAKETGKPAAQVFEQVWFPGVHCDVGGGYKERGLANITLRWMMQRALDANPPLLLRPEFADDPYRDLVEDPHDTLHDSRDKAWKKVLYRVEPRTVCRGAQLPENKIIRKSGDADVSRAWFTRFDKIYRTYDSRSMRAHPDYLTAVKQHDSGQPATGPWQFLVPRE